MNGERYLEYSFRNNNEMEGERILRALKTQGSSERIVEDVKNYLGPVLRFSSRDEVKESDASHFGKYELFSLKLLKQCIELCKKEGERESDPLLQLGSLSIDSLKICTKASGKAPPLSFEKLLYHFVSHCFNCGHYSTGLQACETLHTQLNSVHNQDEKMLLKHTFDLLWKAALKVESRNLPSDLTTADLHLELRGEAFLFIMKLYSESGRERELKKAWISMEIAIHSRRGGTEKRESPLRLLDEAVSQLEPLSSLHPPPSPHFLVVVHENLAITHLWRAICLQESRIDCCEHTPITDVNDGGCPPSTSVKEREEKLCLSVREEDEMLQCLDDVTGCLHSAVESWENVRKGVEKCAGRSRAGECFRDVKTTVHYLQLTASLCVAHFQPSLALKTLGALIEIYKQTPKPEIRAPYQNALAQYHEILQSLEGEGQDVDWQSSLPSSNSGLRGKAATEVEGSGLRCRVASAQIALKNGKLEECRQLLVDVFRSPLLSKRTTLSYSLTAQAKLVASRYLQYCKSELKPSEEFLQYLMNEPSPRAEDKQFTLTPLELASDAVKLYRSLSQTHTPSDIVSVSTWDVLHGLLSSLKAVSAIYLLQGAMREAYYYAREGLMFARSLLLQGWCVEFLLILAETQLTRGQTDSARSLLLQTGRLLDIAAYLSPTRTLPLHPSRCLRKSPARLLHLSTTLRLWDNLENSTDAKLQIFSEHAVKIRNTTAYRHLMLQLQMSRAEAYLKIGETSNALAICDEALASIQPSVCLSPEMALTVAQLHYVAGVASLYTTPTRSPNHVSSSLSSLPVPAPQWKAISHLLSCYQLCFPILPSLLLRDACHWLSVCVGPFREDLASHFLLLGTQVTLNHQAVYTMGKKIRKLHSSVHQSPFQDVLDTLAESSPVPSHPHTSLLTARNVLQPPPSPLPLSHTHNLLSSLPHNWTLCAISLAPKLNNEQDHLIIVHAKFNRGPLFAKIPLQGIVEIEELCEILSASEESMSLTDKRAWWTTRRKLDKQLQELLSRIEVSWLGSWKHFIIHGTPTCSAPSVSHDQSHDPPRGPLVLLLDRLTQPLPWEGLPFLSQLPVCRMPSLSFTVAHRHLLSHSGGVPVDPRQTFFVLNPRQDLPNTEKTFSRWFAKEEGWRGVVGRAPSTEEFVTALEDHQLFVYCGHGTGREYLSTDGFHHVNCRAAAFLMGCSSGKLVSGGRCDPTGMALTYLTSGCPALVASLWDVTDGDIDRFCQSLLKSWLPDPCLPLQTHVANARSACKLRRLIGTAPVVYGIPLWISVVL